MYLGYTKSECVKKYINFEIVSIGSYLLMRQLSTIDIDIIRYYLLYNYFMSDLCILMLISMMSGKFLKQ